MDTSQHRTGRAARRRTRFGMAAAVLAVALTPAAASAHVERPSYWPDPAADCAVTPCAGGAVPTARPLAGALAHKRAGTTRVVCQKDSLARLDTAIADARAHGYDVRPHDHRTLSAKQAKALRKLNVKLFAACRFHEIQPAVTASRNNDRVVVMPGLYTEPTARAAKTHDPACSQYLENNDAGDPGALSYAYQYHCPNDQNLIAVLGREPGTGSDPQPPRDDRHGIPNSGPCVRCNLQLEGSGVGPDDVVIDAGDPAAGNGGPSAVGHKKDVGIRADRADGFVLRNVTVRHAAEHDIYVVETDGYLLDSFKAFYAGGYGVLTFVEDHGVMQNCEAAGNGDSGLYPGAGAKTSAGRDTKVYPEFRYSQEIRFCDSHHNAGGYSGTDGNAVHLHDNNFYENALGFTTDVFTAPGHPGFPQQGDLIENNNFYSNNFNPYADGSDVKPFVATPVGTGLWIAGGNDNILRANHFYDNWRRGVMLFAVPDATVCGPPPLGSSTPVYGCDQTKVSTSYRNSFTANVMGVAPDGTKQANGTDFWWDAFPGTTGNCWYKNVAAPNARITTSPSSLPNCADGTDPGSSMGTGDVANEEELVACLVGFQVSGYPNGNPALCDWTATPARPGTPAAQRAAYAARTRFDRGKSFADFCNRAGVSPTCAPFADALQSAGLALDPRVASFEVDQRTASLQLASPRSQSPAGALSSVVPGSRKFLSLYTCRDWRTAKPALRASILRRLRLWTGGAVQGSRFAGYGTVLDDAAATAFFDNRCSQRWATWFALYKQYGMAAGFAGIAP